MRRFVARAARRIREFRKASPGPYAQLLQLSEAFDQEHEVPDALYFGDSVVERVSREDRDTRTLGQLVCDRLRDSIEATTVSHSAYHMGMYYWLVRALRRMKHRPRIAIVPINIRCFSPQWDLNPHWQFESELEILRTFERQIPLVRPHVVTPEQLEAFDATSVNYPLVTLDRIGHFRLVIGAQPLSAEQLAFRRRVLFCFHYTHPLVLHHPRVVVLRQLLDLLADMNVAVLSYVTPVNYQAGLRHVGPDFGAIVEGNIRLLTDLILSSDSRSSLLFTDLSASLDSAKFFHEESATEHLNEAGRHWVATRIAEAVEHVAASSANAAPTGWLTSGEVP